MQWVLIVSGLMMFTFWRSPDFVTLTFDLNSMVITKFPELKLRISITSCYEREIISRPFMWQNSLPPLLNDVFTSWLFHFSNTPLFYKWCFGYLELQMENLTRNLNLSPIYDCHVNYWLLLLCRMIGRVISRYFVGELPICLRWLSRFG